MLRKALTVEIIEKGPLNGQTVNLTTSNITYFDLFAVAEFLKRKGVMGFLDCENMDRKEAKTAKKKPVRKKKGVTK